MTNEYWENRAACREVGVEAFYPTSQTSPVNVDWAKQICAACPVRSECEADALKLERVWFASIGRYGVHGIRAGLTARERVEILMAERDANRGQSVA